ncbi:MAG: signal peptidase I [Pirellulaceae bacterium]
MAAKKRGHANPKSPGSKVANKLSASEASSGSGAKGESSPNAAKSDASSKASKNTSNKKPDPVSSFQSTRETVESVVVAFVLAFLFRAFVAEAFVIPTGSMAPTLMGAHKDIFCEHCGQQYQASASSEFDSSTGALKPAKTIASLCSNCRGINGYDFRNNSDHATFSGDRILVSKFDYVLSAPQRWDVFVFKFPLHARMNYIKRLIGLPGESLMLKEGDVFVRQESGEYEIARKPPHKIQAMKQLVHDTRHPIPELIEQGWPSPWQPLPGDESWEVDNGPELWSAELEESTDTQWLRYYHKFVDLETWKAQERGESLPTVDPYSSRLITDYLAYNTSSQLRNAEVMFDPLKLSWYESLLPPPLRRSSQWVPNEEKTRGLKVFDAVRTDPSVFAQSAYDNNDGLHWVGDLTGKFEIEVKSTEGSVLLDLVECGVHYQCTIDVATGQAKLEVLDAGETINAFAGQPSVAAQTSLKGAGTYTLEFSNFDEQLVLWINESLVEFDVPAKFNSETYRSGTDRRPYSSATDPLDAAPVGIGGRGVSLSVKSAQVNRDIYYIAVQPFGDFNDYAMTRNSFAGIIPDPEERSQVNTLAQAAESVFSHPEFWSETNLFSLREPRQYKLDEGQYFPLGDNSAQSSDARASEWAGHRYVEERYLLGKALLVFWPHTWNTPVPFTPNFKRMGMIR